MATAKVEYFVRERFATDLCRFIKQKVEMDALTDCEIASLLNVSSSSISKLRRAYGIEKGKAFSKRFERIYGQGAVATFKKTIENPECCLADVGRHFGFSREYARQVYKKIYGCPYAVAHKKKRFLKQEKKVADKRKTSEGVKSLMKIAEKMKSLGLVYNIANRGRSHIILTNGYKVAFRTTSRPITIRKKQYFRINNLRRTDADADFLICLCRTDKKDIHFVIPSDVLPKSTLSLLPHARSDESKYAQFKEAWPLLILGNSNHITSVRKSK